MSEVHTTCDYISNQVPVRRLTKSLLLFGLLIASVGPPLHFPFSNQPKDFVQFRNSCIVSYFFLHDEEGEGILLKPATSPWMNLVQQERLGRRKGVSKNGNESMSREGFDRGIARRRSQRKVPQRMKETERVLQSQNHSKRTVHPRPPTFRTGLVR